MTQNFFTNHLKIRSVFVLTCNCDRPFCVTLCLRLRRAIYRSLCHATYEVLRCEMRGFDRENDVKLAKTTLFELVIMLRVHKIHETESN